MPFIYSMIIVCLIIGFGFIIFSIFRREDKSSSNFFEVEAVVQLINTSIQEADNAIENLNTLSNDIFKEFDEKYQELLFLYQILEEKKSEIARPLDIQASGALVDGDTKPETHVKPKTKNKNKTKTVQYGNPRLFEIKAMRDNGLSVSEIAKELDMGQGEVKMIIELGNLG